LTVKDLGRPVRIGLLLHDSVADLIIKTYESSSWDTTLAGC